MLNLPKVGLKPTHPQNAAGMRTLPPVSLPVAAAQRCATTAAADPPLDPPGMRVGSTGIARRAKERIDRRHAAAELVGVGLAEHHRAGILELLHDGGVVAGNVVVEEQRSRGGADALVSNRSLCAIGMPHIGALRLVVQRPGFAPREVAR